MRLTKDTAKELALELAVFVAGACAIARYHGSPLVLSALLIAMAALIVGGL